jgi:hypothetical protein
MDPKVNLHEKEKLRMAVARDRKLTIAVSLMVCILCAGIIGIEAELPSKADPRTENAPQAIVSPMDPHFEGYLPDDAVIPAKDGIYVTDHEGRFKKLSRGE